MFVCSFHFFLVVQMLRTGGSFGSSDRVTAIMPPHRTDSFQQPHRSNRSQSLEQSGVHSPSSSHSSSSNSFMGTDRNCLRQSAQPKFQISGDLTPQQIQLVKRTWKNVMKSINGDDVKSGDESSRGDFEIAVRLLLRIFTLEPQTLGMFGLPDIPFSDLRRHPLFIQHVKAFEPTLIHTMQHPGQATTLSKYLQQLGGRHVQNTGVTYKDQRYWKASARCSLSFILPLLQTFVQALVEIVGADKASADTYEAFMVLGAFCVEQMRIGYKIESKLQREAERIARVQLQKRTSIHNHHQQSRK
ncbi:GLOBIN domain-containing protein [Aphelenchoides fujianensis]|nr:GLOBIN domain-containing protein [Aphelenchoides fujianensis]